MTNQFDIQETKEEAEARMKRLDDLIASINSHTATIKAIDAKIAERVTKIKKEGVMNLADIALLPLCFNAKSK